MNTKKALMAVVLAVFAAGSAFAYDARAIRKELQTKYAHNLINPCQLAEDGMSLPEVLDRDIQIMEDHKQLTQRRIDDYKSSFMRSVVPFLKKTGAAATGGLSLATWLGLGGLSDWTYRIWKGEQNYAIKTTDALVKTGSFFGFLSDKDVWRYSGEKSNFLCDKVEGYKEAMVLMPILAVTSIVSGYLFIKMARSAWNHHARLDADIAKWQARLDRDIVIIAQLKELKWAATPR